MDELIRLDRQFKAHRKELIQEYRKDPAALDLWVRENGWTFLQEQPIGVVYEKGTVIIKVLKHSKWLGYDRLTTEVIEAILEAE